MVILYCRIAVSPLNLKIIVNVYIYALRKLNLGFIYLILQYFVGVVTSKTLCEELREAIFAIEIIIGIYIMISFTAWLVELSYITLMVESAQNTGE